MLNGTIQYILLAFTLAVIAYIKNNPYKDLKEKLKTYTNEPSNENDKKNQRKKVHTILIQTLFLDVAQIVLASVAVGLLGRELIWHDSFDTLIIWTLFILSIILFFLHLIFNGKAIKAALGRWGSPWKL